MILQIFQYWPFSFFVRSEWENRHTVPYRSKRKIDEAERLPQWQRSRFDAFVVPRDGPERLISCWQGGGNRPKGGTRTMFVSPSSSSSPSSSVTLLPPSLLSFLVEDSRKTPKFSFSQRGHACGLWWLCDLSKYLSSTDSWITNVVFILHTGTRFFLDPWCSFLILDTFHLCTWGKILMNSPLFFVIKDIAEENLIRVFSICER